MARRFGKHGRRKKQVPNLSGLTRSQAQTELTARGFSYSESSLNTSTSGDDTIIASQSVAADTTLLYGDSVTYTYYTYVAPYSNPPPYYNPYSNPPPYYNPYSNPPPYYNPYSNPPPYDNPPYYNPYSNPPPYYNPSGGGGGGCFAFGTLITMSDSTFKLIEEIQIGDELLTLNIEGLPLGENISSWYPKENWSIDSLSNFSTSSTTVTSAIGSVQTSHYLINNKYRVTHEHFIIIKRDNVWQFLTVSELSIGDIFYSLNGDEPIISISEIFEITQVVNIDVEPFDLYFADGILVHNIKPFNP